MSKNETLSTKKQRAIEPDELMRLCRAAIEAMIRDRDAWLAIQGKDKTERQALLAQLQDVKTNLEGNAA